MPVVCYESVLILKTITHIADTQAAVEDVANDTTARCIGRNKAYGWTNCRTYCNGANFGISPPDVAAINVSGLNFTINLVAAYGFTKIRTLF